MLFMFTLLKHIYLAPYLKGYCIDIVPGRRDLDDLGLHHDLSSTRHLSDAFVTAAGGAEAGPRRRLQCRRLPWDGGREHSNGRNKEKGHRHEGGHHDEVAQQAEYRSTAVYRGPAYSCTVVQQ